MRKKEKKGMLKKVSAIGLLAVIIITVIVLGLSAVNAAGQENYTNETVVTNVNVSPSEVTLNVTETRQFTATALDQNGTPIPDAKFSWIVDNSTVGKVDETGLFTALCPGTTFFSVTADNVTGTATVTVTAQPTTTGVIPWIAIGIIVFISFLIFFGIVGRTEEKLWHYIFILWIASAIIVPIGLFFVLSLFHFEKFGFERDHVIVAIVASISLPLIVLVLVSVLDSLIKKGEKEREEPSREEETSYSVNFEVFDEKNKHPISDATIWVTKSGNLICKGPTNQAGIYECPCSLKSGKYAYKIEPYGAYKPKSGSFPVDRSGTVSIPLTARTVNLTVLVKDLETGNSVQGVNVSVSEVEKRTDEHGKALFPGVTIGAKEIKVDEISGVYSSGTKTCEIREDTTTEVSVSIKSLLRIPIDKENKLNALRNQLQDNYRRVSTYDSCIPSYYKSIVDNLVNLIKGFAGKPMLFVDSKRSPEETIGHLVDAVDLVSREIIGVMSSKRNVDVYSAAMRLEKAEVGAKPIDFHDSRVVDYIRDAEAFYNSYYHTAQSKLFEIDTNITRKTGEMNVLPVSGLWRVARTLLNETSSTAEADYVKRGAMTLVADILLDYTDDMLKDAKIIERLKIMVI